MSSPKVRYSVPTGSGRAVARIDMAAPRANALEPGILGELHAALDCAERDAVQAVLICGGANFSTGGDVLRFRDAMRAGRAASYAREVVGSLQSLVLRLVSAPMLVAVAARGAVTGGSAGLLFAADVAVVAPDAFVQPYYAEVGFAPDGGWTALLPERIGAGRALDWILSDRRQGAEALVALGLAGTVSDSPEQTAEWALGALDPGARLTAKALVWDATRIATVEARLAAETAAFIERLGSPETADGMARFLGAKAAAHV